MSWDWCQYYSSHRINHIEHVSRESNISEQADKHIDSLLEKFGIEILSDSSSISALDSETEEEAELIEINFKIEEMRWVCSVATLL